MKKGFTLAELLAVVVLLGLLLTIMYPKVLEIFEKKEQELDDAKLKLLYTAAEQYLYSENHSIGDVVCIPINTLDRENLIPIELDNDILEKKVRVKIGKTNSYDVVGSDCKSYTGNTNSGSDSGESGSEEETTPSEPDDNVNIIKPVISPKEYNSSDAIINNNGYAYTEKVLITFDYNSNYNYYFKSTKGGTSSVSLYSSCGTETHPSDCGRIQSSNSIEANRWYDLPDMNTLNTTVEITYDEDYNSSANLIVIVEDKESKEFVTVSYTTSKIDRTPPVINGLSYRGFYDMLVLDYSIYDSGSGFGSADCLFRMGKGYYSSINATNSTCYIPLEVTPSSYGNYELNVYDAVGNKAEYYSGSVKIDINYGYYSNY